MVHFPDYPEADDILRRHDEGSLRARIGAGKEVSG